MRHLKLFVMLIFAGSLFFSSCQEENLNENSKQSSQQNEPQLQMYGCNADCCASSLLGGSCAANGPDAYCEAGLFGVCCDADTRDGNDCKGGNIQDASEEQISNNQAYQNYLESEIGTPQALEVKEAAQALIDAAQNSNLEGYNNAYNNYVDEHNELDDSNQEKVNEWLRENYEDEDHQLESELEVN